MARRRQFRRHPTTLASSTSAVYAPATYLGDQPGAAPGVGPANHNPNAPGVLGLLGQPGVTPTNTATGNGGGGVAPHGPVTVPATHSGGGVAPHGPVTVTPATPAPSPGAWPMLGRA